MGKDKIKRFQENRTFECMVQPLFEEVFHKDYKLKGRWRSDFFKNDNPIILELGCGRGEYTIGLAKMCPDKNFIGIDVKGARIWRGGRTATDDKMNNVGFLRTRIEFIESFFSEGEIDEIWITFADPQLKKTRSRKRLTSSTFLTQYAKFLKKEGVINLKTDSPHLHLYTRWITKLNGLTEYVVCDDIYNDDNRKVLSEEVLEIKTTYENRFLSEGYPITFLKFGLMGKKEFVEEDFDMDDMPDDQKR